MAWAVVLVLLLCQFAGFGAVPLPADRHSTVLRAADPAPHPGGPFESAMTAAEAEPEPGRSKPLSMKPAAPTALFARAAAKTQAPVEALAFHAQRPRRPLGQAPPRAA